MRLRLVLFLAALGWCNYAIGQDVGEPTPLQRVCVAGAVIIAAAIEETKFDVPVTMLEESSAPDAQYWYGEWFGHLIPVPTIDIELSVRAHYASTSLSGNDNFRIGGAGSVVGLGAGGFDALVYDFGLTPSPVPDLAALRAGFVGDPKDFECDEDNPEATLRRIDELVLRSTLVVRSSFDHIYFLGERAVLTYQQLGDQDVWNYHFAVDAQPPTLAMISIVADRTMYPKAGFSIVKSAEAYSYANAEPGWIQGVFSEGEKAFSKVLGLTAR